MEGKKSDSSPHDTGAAEFFSSGMQRLVSAVDLALWRCLFATTSCRHFNGLLIG
jgi:hypothetical protein